MKNYTKVIKFYKLCLLDQYEQLYYFGLKKFFFIVQCHYYLKYLINTNFS